LEAPKSFGQAVSQAGQLWRGLTLGQRALLAVGVGAVGLTLWLFADLVGKPKYVTLYSGLKPPEAQEMGSRLAAKNIPYELTPDGTGLLVPADQLDASRIETASQGLPRNARLGFEIFDTPNWAGSDFTEKVNYQRALEGELERTLQTLSEVESVRVHLVLPHESLFTDQERQAKAAVIIKTHGGSLSEQAQLAIPQLVASAVDGLRPENVTVVDADTNTPLLHPHGPGGEYASYDLDDELNKTLLRTLEPVVGSDHVRASVHVEYDLSSSDNTEEIYDPKTTATLTQQKSDENSNGGGAIGIPGTASNLPQTTAAEKSGSVSKESSTKSNTTPTYAATPETETSHSESETFGVSKSVRHVTQPPGRIKRISAAVLVDDAVEISEKNGSRTATRRKRTADELKQIEQLASAAIGIDTPRGDILSVQNLSFEQMPEEKPAPPTKIEVTRRYLTEWSGLLRFVGIAALFLIVYLLILRPIKAQLITAFRELPARAAEGAKALVKSAGGSSSEPMIELPVASEQAQRAQALKKQLTEKIRTEPAAASRLVQSWIREDEK